MITDILNHWVTVFQTQLQQETLDELRLSVVKKAPFQEDPTRKAPYLLLDIDEEKGLEPDDPQEIGGSLYWKAYLKIRAAPRVQTSPDRAYELVGVLSQRIVYILRQHWNDRVVFASGAYTNNFDWKVIRRVQPKVYGGEREWLSYVDVYFVCRISEPWNQPAMHYPEIGR